MKDSICVLEHYNLVGLTKKKMPKRGQCFPKEHMHCECVERAHLNELEEEVYFCVEMA